jgi:hypothetical protein
MTNYPKGSLSLAVKNKVIHKPTVRFPFHFPAQPVGEGGGDNGGLLPSIHPREKSGPGTVSNTDIPTLPHECQFFVILICSNMKIFSDTTKHIWFSDGRNRRFFKTSVSDP